MRKFRGFRLGCKLLRVSKWVIQRRTKQTTYQRLDHPSYTTKAVEKLCNWGRFLKHRAKGLYFSKSKSGYIRVSEDPIVGKPASVPKGHLVVYVGEKQGDMHKFLVPVMYFNHPLFEQLLRESEMVYGFNHPGGIQIPSRIAEFKNVQMRIASDGGGSCRRRRSWLS